MSLACVQGIYQVAAAGMVKPSRNWVLLCGSEPTWSLLVLQVLHLSTGVGKSCSVSQVFGAQMDLGVYKTSDKRHGLFCFKQGPG